MNVSMKLLSRIFKVLKTSKKIEDNHRKILCYKNGENFRVFKTGICVIEPYQVYIGTKFQVDILKITEFRCFEGWKRPFSRFSRRFLYFPDFQNKKCYRVNFRVLDEKVTQKHVSRHPKLKFLVWPFLDLVTLNDLNLEYAHRKLKMIPRSVSDAIYVVVLTYFHLIRF